MRIIAFIYSFLRQQECLKGNEETGNDLLQCLETNEWRKNMLEEKEEEDWNLLRWSSSNLGSNWIQITSLETATFLFLILVCVSNVNCRKEKRFFFSWKFSILGMERKREKVSEKEERERWEWTIERGFGDEREKELSATLCWLGKTRVRKRVSECKNENSTSNTRQSEGEDRVIYQLVKVERNKYLYI